MPRRTFSPEEKRILGSNIRAARERIGLEDQGEAATRATMSRSMLSQWENGKLTPNADGLLRLAIAFGCPLDDFFGGVDEAYDDIIERRLPMNAQQFYKAKAARLKALTAAAIDLTVEAVETRAPTRGAQRGTGRIARGKSKSARARRKPKH